jgi:hypothetical protein
MSDYGCKEECNETGLSCQNKACRQWIDYDEDLNCCLIAVDKNGPMTLDDVSKRIGLSLVRIKQIEQIALEKAKKRNSNLLKDLLHE